MLGNGLTIISIFLFYLFYCVFVFGGELLQNEGVCELFVQGSLCIFGLGGRLKGWGKYCVCVCFGDERRDLYEGGRGVDLFLVAGQFAGTADVFEVEERGIQVLFLLGDGLGLLCFVVFAFLEGFCFAADV